MKNNDYAKGNAMNSVFQKDTVRIFAAKCDELYSYPPMFHKNMEIILVTEGELELIINGAEIHMEKGGICFTFPYAIHGNRYQKAEYILISFDPDLCVPFSAILSNQKCNNNLDNNVVMVFYTRVPAYIIQ